MDEEDESLEGAILNAPYAWLILGAFTTAFPSIAEAHFEYLKREGASDGIYIWSSFLLNPLIENLGTGRLEQSQETRFWETIERLLATGDRDVRNWVYCEVMEVVSSDQQELMGPLASRVFGEYLETMRRIREENSAKLRGHQAPS